MLGKGEGSSVQSRTDRTSTEYEHGTYVLLRGPEKHQIHSGPSFFSVVETIRHWPVVPRTSPAIVAAPYRRRRRRRRLVLGQVPRSPSCAVAPCPSAAPPSRCSIGLYAHAPISRGGISPPPRSRGFTTPSPVPYPPTPGRRLTRGADIQPRTGPVPRAVWSAAARIARGGLDTRTHARPGRIASTSLALPLRLLGRFM